MPTQYILPASTNVNALVDGTISPATAYTITDYVAGQGARRPTSATSQRQFTMAVVVLSYGRLLSDAEMAYFDNASARGETRIALQSTIGRAPGFSSGFYLATGGRAMLRTRLP